MKIFIDTANVEEIRKASKLGVLAGVTTNPSLIAKEGRDIKEVIEEICSIVDGPISAEVMALECDEMVREGRELAKIHKNIVIKIPMCEEGLKAVKVLASEGIRTNVTLIFSPLQALLAARAGASFVPSPVTATTAPFCCNNCTRRCLSVGRARHMIFRSSTRSSASSSVKASNPGPVIILRSVSFSVQVPI